MNKKEESFQSTATPLTPRKFINPPSPPFIIIIINTKHHRPDHRETIAHTVQTEQNIPRNEKQQQAGKIRRLFANNPIEVLNGSIYKHKSVTELIKIRAGRVHTSPPRAQAFLAPLLAVFPQAIPSTVTSPMPGKNAPPTTEAL